MATKRAIDLQVGDMIFAYGNPAEVERVRGPNFIRNADGECAAGPLAGLKPESVQVCVKWWEECSWQTEVFTFCGNSEISLCLGKHIVMPAGKYRCRDLDTGEVYMAEMPYTVGYQFEVKA